MSYHCDKNYHQVSLSLSELSTATQIKLTYVDNTNPEQPIMA